VGTRGERIYCDGYNQRGKEKETHAAALNELGRWPDVMVWPLLLTVPTLPHWRLSIGGGEFGLRGSGRGKQGGRNEDGWGSGGKVAE
jgi:hypothetical protein